MSTATAEAPATVHTLKAKGAAFNKSTMTRVDKNTTAGSGVAVCSCGWTSEVLPSGKQRVTAHKEHKASESVKADAKHASENWTNQTDPGAPSFEEPAEKAAPADLPAEEDLIGDVAPEPVVKPEKEIHRDFPGNYSIVMIPFVEDLAEAFGGINVRQQTFPGKLERRAHISGSRADVTEFAKILDKHVHDVFPALKAWQKENIEVRRTQTDMQKYLGHREFIANYGKRAAAELKASRS